MSTVTVPALRRTNEITATSLAHSQTGEKTRSTFVPVIGLRSSLSRSVTAKAAAVAPSRARTISVWGSRDTAGTYSVTDSHRRSGREADAFRVAPRASESALADFGAAH